MLPTQFRVSRPDEFIGPARQQAQFIDRLVAASRASGAAPIKLLILGAPGIGKSELAEHFCRAVGANKWSTVKYNGTSFRIEDCEELARTMHFTNMWGEYRVVRIEEVDKVPTVAQVRLLTVLDDLPPRNAVVCTSNCSIKGLENRFQRRFQVIDLGSPRDEEIASFLLTHWPMVGQGNASMIASLACGNVGQALMDAQTAII